MTKLTKTQYEINSELHERSGVEMVTTIHLGGQRPNWALGSWHDIQDEHAETRLRNAVIDLQRDFDMSLAAY